MNIFAQFIGDEDLATQREQHDVYSHALRIIMHGCLDHMVRAARLLGQPVPRRWENSVSYDHRTLQDAHDILAAVWRWRTDSQQLRLPFDGRPDTVDRRMAAWLFWLEREVASWVEAPRIVQAVMLILAQQNTDAGNLGERHLARLLKMRHEEVPWRWIDLPEIPPPTPGA